MLVREMAHEVLRRQGVTTIFGNPGSNELPFLAGLPDDFRYVLGLQEAAVVAMADGYTQVSGRTALVNLHAASGTGNAMGALTNAVYARSPLVLVAGQQVRAAIGTEAMLANVDAPTLTRPLTGWSAEPACASDVPRALAQAIFEARLRRNPTYLSVPYDDWSADAPASASYAVGRTVDRATIPGGTAFEQLLHDVSVATHPALVLGGDVDTAGRFDAATDLAELLGADTWSAPSAFRLPFPNRHKLFRGVLPAGVAPIARALAGHDLVLVLGAPVFRYHENVPGEMLPEGTRLVQVTDDPGAAARAPMGEAIIAEPGAVIDQLLKSLRSGPHPRGGFTPAPPAPHGADGRMHPEQVFATLRNSAASDTRYVVESTSTNAAWWRQMDLRQGGSYFFPASGGLGFGIPAAVGVALADHDRPVVAVIGDGSANYGIAGLWSAAQMQLPVTYVVLRNGVYGALQWFGDLLGTPDVPGMTIPGLDFTTIAQGYGVPASHAGTEEELADLFGEDHDGPYLIQVDTTVTTPS